MSNHYKRFHRKPSHFGNNRIKIDQQNPDKEASLSKALNELNLIFLEKTKNRRGKKNRRNRK